MGSDCISSLSLLIFLLFIKQSINRCADQSINDFNIAFIVGDILFISSTIKLLQKRWNRMPYFTTTNFVIIYMNMTVDISFNEILPLRERIP